MGDSLGHPYRSYRSLEEASGDPDAVVILEGDDGGQIYCVAPVRETACALSALEQLLVDIDELSWPGSDPTSRRVLFEHAPIGSVIPADMGGGASTGEIWVHPRLVEGGLDASIREVIRGTRDRIMIRGSASWPDRDVRSERGGGTKSDMDR